MPELPEVETFREDFQERFVGRRIAGVQLEPDSRLRDPFPADLEIRLSGTQFTGTRRHGKYLFAGTEGGGSLVLHFGMTGHFQDLSASEAAPPYWRLLIRFRDGGRLVLCDMRKLGTVNWADSVEAFVAARNLGPDAMDPGLDPVGFEAIFAGRRALLKPALMNQSLISGIGNLYADEILYQRGIHPGRRIHELPGGELGMIFRAMREVLTTSVRLRADFSRFPDNYLLFDRRVGRGCPRCSGTLDRMQIQGRTAVFCPGHQD